MKDKRKEHLFIFQTIRKIVEIFKDFILGENLPSFLFWNLQQKVDFSLRCRYV